MRGALEQLGGVALRRQRQPAAGGGLDRQQQVARRPPHTMAGIDHVLVEHGHLIAEGVEHLAVFDIGHQLHERAADRPGGAAEHGLVGDALLDLVADQERFVSILDFLQILQHDRLAGAHQRLEVPVEVRRALPGRLLIGDVAAEEFGKAL